MGIEDVTLGSLSSVVAYGLGGRGIDRIEKVAASTSVGYPIYDGQGSMIATLSKSGSTFALADQLRLDAWGAFRTSPTNGDPTGRYCANIGHKQDDESGLTYMRARYYEAESGRFITQDPSQDGLNWFVYCGNNSLSNVDQTGRTWDPAEQMIMLAVLQLWLKALQNSPSLRGVALQWMGYMDTMTQFGITLSIDYSDKAKRHAFNDMFQAFTAKAI